MKLSVFLLCLSLFHFSSVQCNELDDNNANAPSIDSSLQLHTNHIRTAEQLIKTTRSGDEERTQPLDGDAVETEQRPDALTKRIEWDDEKTKEELTPIQVRREEVKVAPVQSKPTAVRRVEEEKREAKRKADEEEEKRMKVKREEETRHRFAEAPTHVKARPGIPEAPHRAADSEETTPTARQFRARVKEAPPAVEEQPVAVPREVQLPELRVRTRMEQVPRVAKPPALPHRPAVKEEPKPIESETEEEIQPEQLQKHRLTRLTPIYQAEHNKQARLVLHRPEPAEEEVVTPTPGRVEQVPEAAKKRRVVAVRPEPVEEIVRVRVERSAESPEAGKKRRVRTMRPEPVEEPVEEPAEEEVEKPLRMLRVKPVERIEQLEEDAKEQPQVEEPEEETRIRFRGTEPPTNVTTPATNATQPTPPTPTTTCPQIPSTPCPEVRPCRCPTCPQPFQSLQPLYPSKPAFTFPQTQPTTTTATTIPYQLLTQYQWPHYQLARQQNIRQLQHRPQYYQPGVSTPTWSRWTPRATFQFQPTHYAQPMF